MIKMRVDSNFCLTFTDAVHYKLVTFTVALTTIEDDADAAGRDQALYCNDDSELLDRQETVHYFTDVHHIDPFQAFASDAK